MALPLQEFITQVGYRDLVSQTSRCRQVVRGSLFRAREIASRFIFCNDSVLCAICTADKANKVTDTLFTRLRTPGKKQFALSVSRWHHEACFKNVQKTPFYVPLKPQEESKIRHSAPRGTPEHDLEQKKAAMFSLSVKKRRAFLEKTMFFDVFFVGQKRTLLLSI